MVKNCSIDVIIDHLIGECIENHRWKLQTVFVLNEVIRSSQQLEGNWLKNAHILSNQRVCLLENFLRANYTES